MPCSAHFVGNRLLTMTLTWRRGANEAKVDQTTEMYFLLSDPFI